MRSSPVASFPRRVVSTSMMAGAGGAGQGSLILTCEVVPLDRQGKPEPGLLSPARQQASSELSFHFPSYESSSKSSAPLQALDENEIITRRKHCLLPAGPLLAQELEPELDHLPALPVGKGVSSPAGEGLWCRQTTSLAHASCTPSPSQSLSCSRTQPKRVRQLLLGTGHARSLHPHCLPMSPAASIQPPFGTSFPPTLDGHFILQHLSVAILLSWLS